MLLRALARGLRTSVGRTQAKVAQFQPFAPIAFMREDVVIQAKKEKGEKGPKKPKQEGDKKPAAEAPKKK